VRTDTAEAEGEEVLGAPVDWRPVQAPARTELRGAHVLLRPLGAPTDADSLYAATHAPEGDETVWRYLFDGPHASAEDLRTMLGHMQRSSDPLFYAVVPQSDRRALGLISFLRITPEFGTIEIGNVCFGASLQRTTAATEALYLLLRHAFDQLGYRRMEWKCNALNEPSRRAAERFGFVFEGIFRKHYVVKGRNRDTAWYAMLDDEWPSIRAGFTAWLAAENFTPEGCQIRSLAELIAAARVSAAPGAGG
jgi:RimJ/RimL family protein N-acetyltransferase